LKRRNPSGCSSRQAKKIEGKIKKIQVKKIGTKEPRYVTS
jgi:hypothetical protein